MFEKYTYVIIFGILAVLLSNKPQAWQTNAKRKRNICVFLFFFIVYQNGFRDYLHIANDTCVYLESYKNLMGIPLSDMLKDFSIIADDYSDRDPGYYIFVRLTQYVYPDFRFLLVLIAMIIGYPLCKILYRYSTSVAGIFLGMTLYEALFANFFDTGMRQTIAMGILFTAFLIQQEGSSWIKWGILVLIAYTFHTSSLVFLPMFFVSKIKNQTFLMKCAIVITPLIFMFARPIIAYIGAGTIFEGYAINSEDDLGTPVFSVMVIVAVVATKLLDKRINFFYAHPKELFSAMIMALMLTPASWVDSNFIRLTFYYLIFLMPLMSVIIDAVCLKSNNSKSLLYLCFAGTLIFLTLNQ